MQDLPHMIEGNQSHFAFILYLYLHFVQVKLVNIMWGFWLFFLHTYNLKLVTDRRTRLWTRTHVRWLSQLCLFVGRLLRLFVHDLSKLSSSSSISLFVQETS